MTIDTTSFEAVRYEAADGVATITLDRPDKHNAFSPTMIAEITALWQHLRFDDEVRAVIVTGAGDRAFSSGVDLTFEHPQPSSPLMHEDPLLRIGPKSNDMWKPVIAAVNGLACGGAFYVLGEVEFIIAADTATFFDPHLTHAMPAVFEPMFMLQRMPLGEIMRLSLLGRAERMTAERAFNVGLVQEVTAPDALMDAAMWSARTIADHPDPGTVEATVRAIWTAQRDGFAAGMNAAPLLVNLVAGTTEMAVRANELRGTKIEPRLR